MHMPVKDRIENGVSLLEEFMPDGEWADYIDLDTLNLGDCRSCVLGQLAVMIAPAHLKGAVSRTVDKFAAGVEAVEDRLGQEPSTEDYAEWSIEYGFDRVPGDVEWVVIQAEWVRRIELARVENQSHG